MRLLELGIRPRQILTKEAFENAIAVAMALGGSTNVVLHLLAIANEARVDLELDDFNKVAARVPHIADMKPHGRFHMVDLDRIGGVPVVMQRAARRRPPPRRLHHRHRQDHGREPGRPRPGRARRRGRPPADRRRSTPTAASSSSAVRWRRRARSSKWRASTRPRSRAPARRVRRRGRCHGGDPRRQDRAGHGGRDPLRGPQGRARACARCSRSPAR